MTKNVCLTKCENGVRKDRDCECCRCGANTIFNIIHVFIWIPRVLIGIGKNLNRFICSVYGSIWLLCSRHRRRLSHIPTEAITERSCTHRSTPIGSRCVPLCVTSTATYIFMICWHHTDCRIHCDIPLILLLLFYVYEAAETKLQSKKIIPLMRPRVFYAL